jgi:hypothetical protein
MKLYKYLICMGISTICCSIITYGEGNNNQIQLDKSSNQEVKAIVTFESINEWKATLSSTPLFHKVPGINGKEAILKNIVYYVEYLSQDSNEVRRIWQCEFSILEESPDANPHNFIFGTTDSNNFCIAFLRGPDLNYFILEPNSKLIPYTEESKSALDKNSPTALIIDRNPNNVISLYQISFNKIFPSYSPNTIFIDSVCSYENYAIFNLTIKGQKFILHYTIIDGKPVYSVYKISDSEK